MAFFFEKLAICGLVFYVTTSSTQPLFVTRNYVDSFQVEEYSCQVDERICSWRNALCRPDGNCLCRNNTPDYVNPLLNVEYGYLSHGVVDGCVAVGPLVDSIDPYNLACSYSFRPFQLVSSTRQDQPIIFIHSAATHYSTCNFTSALVKYPNNKSWMQSTWLTEKHTDINMTSVGILLFGWRMPVPQLQGLMVIIKLNCSRIELNHLYKNETYVEQCLRMKVLGTVYSSSIRIRKHAAELHLFPALAIAITYLLT